jgi:hypothetical protein
LDSLDLDDDSLLDLDDDSLLDSEDDLLLDSEELIDSDTDCDDLDTDCDDYEEEDDSEKQSWFKTTVNPPSSSAVIDSTVVCILSIV